MNDRAESNYDPEDFYRLTTAVCSWYVRRDGKYYDIDRTSVKLSKDDVIRASLVRFKQEFPTVEYNPALLRDVFDTAIDKKHAEAGASIPVWDGRVLCNPANEVRQLPDRGLVTINSWRRPDYRQLDVEPEMGVAAEFFETIFPTEREREMVLDWLTWCLRYEAEKPTWAPFLYSETKGSGKSTFCQLVAALFGTENTATQNGLDKITGRFNSTVMTSKLVICEEVRVRQESPQANSLKTYITDPDVLVERKGQEAERIPNCCCFLFTSNHLPLWIEAEDRRYYLIEIDHDGHSAGPRAAEFAALVERVHEFMRDPRALAGLYAALMERQLRPGFSAKALNVVDDATPLMRRVHGASELTARAQLREHLDAIGAHALPESDVTRVLREDLGLNINSTKHLMTELGWSKQMVKWGGKDYARSIWVRQGFWVEGGRLRGPEGYEQGIVAHLERREDEELV